MANSPRFNITEMPSSGSGREAKFRDAFDRLDAAISWIYEVENDPGSSDNVRYGRFARVDGTWTGVWDNGSAALMLVDDIISVSATEYAVVLTTNDSGGGNATGSFTYALVNGFTNFVDDDSCVTDTNAKTFDINGTPTSSATGEYAGHATPELAILAERTEANWEFVSPSPGMRFYTRSPSSYRWYVVYDGIEWTRIAGQNEYTQAVADLDQTITDPPTQAEVQDISDKIDQMLSEMGSPYGEAGLFS